MLVPMDQMCSQPSQYQAGACMASCGQQWPIQDPLQLQSQLQMQMPLQDAQGPGLQLLAGECAQQWPCQEWAMPAQTCQPLLEQPWQSDEKAWDQSWDPSSMLPPWEHYQQKDLPPEQERSQLCPSVQKLFEAHDLQMQKQKEEQQPWQDDGRQLDTGWHQDKFDDDHTNWHCQTEEEYDWNEAADAQYEHEEKASTAGSSQPLSASAARRLRRHRAQQRGTDQKSQPDSSHGNIGQRSEQREEPHKAETRLSAAQIAELRSQLESADKGTLRAALSAMQGSVVELSKDAVGCRLVQKALECGERGGKVSAVTLAQELQGFVCEAMMSPHANYVVQKVVTQLPASVSDFVTSELLGSAAKIARHRYGCRIFCRLMEFNAARPNTGRLIDEILADAKELCRHSFAQFVMQSILEHGNERQRGLVVSALLQSPFESASNKSASFLVQQALMDSSPQNRSRLLQELGKPEVIAKLAPLQYGQYVAKSLLQCHEVDAEEVFDLLRMQLGEEYARQLRTQLDEERKS